MPYVRTPVKVRLTEAEIRGILDCVETLTRMHLVDCTLVSLFGSRVDLSQRGGDIDLYVQVKNGPGIVLFILKRDLTLLLKEKLGDQKIDIIFDDGKVELGAFGKMVRESKVDIWTKN
mgnify:CR=1 FL=1